MTDEQRAALALRAAAELVDVREWSEALAVLSAVPPAVIMGAAPATRRELHTMAGRCELAILGATVSRGAATLSAATLPQRAAEG